MCAALNSFWPAAAPDASRTFFVSESFDKFNRQPTSIPHTDAELGIHPKFAELSGQTASLGWDGEQGPFLEVIEGVEHVNYADIARSDYTENAWKGKMHMKLLKDITTDELIGRMESLRDCYDALPPDNDRLTSTDLWLVSFVKIENWINETDKLESSLQGNGYKFIFVTINKASIPNNKDVKRLFAELNEKFECHVDHNSILWKQTSNDFSSLNSFNRETGSSSINFI